MNKKLIEAASLGVIIMGTISAITLVTVMLKKYKDEDDIKETTKDIEEKSNITDNISQFGGRRNSRIDTMDNMFSRGFGTGLNNSYWDTHGCTGKIENDICVRGFVTDL